MQPPAGGTLPPGANVSDGTFVKVPLVVHIVLPLPEYPASQVTECLMTMADCEILEWKIDNSIRHTLLKVVLPAGHGQILLRVIVAGTRYSNAMNISYSPPKQTNKNYYSLLLN